MRILPTNEFELLAMIEADARRVLLDENRIERCAEDVLQREFDRELEEQK